MNSGDGKPTSRNLESAKVAIDQFPVGVEDVFGHYVVDFGASAVGADVRPLDSPVGSGARAARF